LYSPIRFATMSLSIRGGSMTSPLNVLILSSD
jgi:hypothetical protein